jgi:hypothetical protein
MVIHAPFIHTEMEELSVTFTRFIERFRRKFTSPNHQFKKTDRIDMHKRYPNLKEELKKACLCLEEGKMPEIDIEKWQKIMKTQYDEELFAAWQRFLELLKQIFKKNKNS